MESSVYLFNKPFLDSTYINNLLPRNITPIKNYIEVINPSNDDFHIIVYYVNIHKIKIIIRRLDNNSGWDIDLKIKLLSLNNDDYEIISIGSYHHNCKIISFITTINIYKADYLYQKIPKIIIQTTPNKEIKNILHYNSILSFIELNPEYEYRIFDNYECRKFIKENFEEDVVNAYDILLAGSFKADLFRYCYLYIHGGCYFDCKQILRKPLRNLIEPDEELILCNDMNGGYFNAVMMASKKNEYILKVIELCKNKILNFNNYFNIHESHFNHISKILGLTGPHLLSDALHHYVNNQNCNINLKFHHKFQHKLHKYQELLIEFNNEVIITKAFNGYLNNNHYSDLWFNKLILYKNIIINEINDNIYKFYVYPHHHPDKYNFYILDENRIIVERNDSNSGWNNDLKINLINESENTENSINFGKSNSKYKIYEQLNLFGSLNYNINYDIEKIDNEFEDEFEFNIICYNNLLQLVIIRVDNHCGWGQNLKILYKSSINKNSEEYIEIIIGPSSEFIKIINII